MMHNDYPCFRANRQRISSLDSQFNPRLDFKKRDTALSAAPMLQGGKRFAAYSKGFARCQDQETDAVIWETTAAGVAHELFLMEDMLFLSDHRQITVLDRQDGKLIQQIQVAAYLGNAVLLEKLLIWNVFSEGKNFLYFFDTETFSLQKEFFLDDLASFVLSDGKSVLYNQYPNWIKSLDPIQLATNWQLDMQVGNGTNFINEYPFVIDGHLYVSQFPDKLKKVSTANGEIAWEICAKTGINSFPSNYFVDHTIGYLSGSTLLIIDYITGEIVHRYEFPGIKQLKENAFSVSYFTQDAVFLYTQRAGIVLEINLKSLELTYSFQAKKGLKTAPIIAGNTVFLMDTVGNLYY